ncbi:RloB family protein [Anaeromicropila populeti]|uniref:RloB-like protein n=1 Tax=Anaeromicropila populeti TaxID=37658 RepID=A0A1I6IC86_9FIRM|nr:RloB family protein [Anaeromicropila populeti]SFR64367.1 RloB-like protein [Anaeromicropila populeti]
MGTDNLFKKRREDRKKRNFAFKSPKANSFLIVTEGERTEPLYFKGIKEIIQLKIGGAVEVIELPTIDIHGEGCSTGTLIERTDEIVKKANIMYQNVWVVFDKDDFEDFNQAIKSGMEKGYKVAWSNQSFEYWIYLHFNYSDAALHRHEWNKKLDEIFDQNKLKDGKYKKITRIYISC